MIYLIGHCPEVVFILINGTLFVKSIVYSCMIFYTNEAILIRVMEDQKLAIAIYV